MLLNDFDSLNNPAVKDEENIFMLSLRKEKQ